AASVNYHGASPWPPSTLRDNFDLASSMKLHRSSRWYPIETAPLPTAADAFPGLATVLSFFELQARVAQWIRAFASGAKGRRFDPCRGYQILLTGDADDFGVARLLRTHFGSKNARRDESFPRSAHTYTRYFLSTGE